MRLKKDTSVLKFGQNFAKWPIFKSQNTAGDTKNYVKKIKSYMSVCHQNLGKNLTFLFPRTRLMFQF